MYRTPISLHQYHKKFTLRDVDGRDIVELNVIRPSVEAWQELRELGELMAEMLTERLDKMESQSTITGIPDIPSDVPRGIEEFLVKK